ncbi:homogentisate 1,2-dioxygenase [Actinomadura meyerae]|jgi:homogentisate 1,2-dioxygenase|uniref:Homogentisate 1,2-dioxygenase n=1 Tax=Actinomadura meyerae TaxID=240840 RepID=A0A239NFL2_9ACTN|nr:homogentisate 1,2-dioxygenase [Actinomadura meyerae]SNT53550.1 homogentisate 1,2-dioxygenase [Actinomadura meyerae]
MVMYRQMGRIPRRRHTQFRDPESGGLYYEEMQGEEGFSWTQSFLYHRELPTVITAAEAVELDDRETVPNAPLLPRHVLTHKLGVTGDAVTGRQVIVGNPDLTVSYVAANRSSGLYRNAIGDELCYVESGTAVLESSYGDLTVGEGDYVVIPASTTHRWALTSDELRLLVVEATGTGHIRPPRKFMSPVGQFLDGAPYNERDLRAPEVLPAPRTGEADVLVRTRTGCTRYRYAFHPFDVVGWDGYNYPYAFNIGDYLPTTGALHLPPPTYITFEGPGFVVCSFVPRMFDYHPDAVKVPYAHANVDSDEVLFYTGAFLSRAGSGIEPGSVSLHPAGHVHGPQPGSHEKTLGMTSTDETAVMIDTFRPLRIGKAALGVEDDAYAWSWARGAGRAAGTGAGSDR